MTSTQKYLSAVPSATDHHRWFYKILHEEVGPVTTDELLHVYKSGRLVDGTFIRHVDDATWLPVELFRNKIASLIFQKDAKQRELTTAAEEGKRRQSTTKQFAERNASEIVRNPMLPLIVRDGDPSQIVGKYTSFQIGQLYLSARITAVAEFRHPNEQVWRPCSSLLEGKSSTGLTLSSTIEQFPALRRIALFYQICALVILFCGACTGVFLLMSPEGPGKLISVGILAAAFLASIFYWGIGEAIEVFLRIERNTRKYEI